MKKQKNKKLVKETTIKNIAVNDTPNIYDKQFYSNQRSGSSHSAEIIVPMLMKLINPKSVIDVGCGIGTWLHEFEKSNVTNYIGIDSHAQTDMLLIEPSKYATSDLNVFDARPFSRFDMAISLETAEHLKPEAAENFIKNLTLLSDIVVFSAAIPHQGGLNHINERWQSYWAGLFKQNGYACIDYIRPKLWGDSRVELCYAQNILIFVKQSTSNVALEQEQITTELASLDHVHPKIYESMAIFENMTRKQWLLATKMMIKRLFLSLQSKINGS